MMRGHFTHERASTSRQREGYPRSIAAIRQRETDRLTIAALLFGTLALALLATSLGLMSG